MKDTMSNVKGNTMTNVIKTADTKVIGDAMAKGLNANTEVKTGVKAKGNVSVETLVLG